MIRTITFEINVEVSKRAPKDYAENLTDSVQRLTDRLKPLVKDLAAIQFSRDELEKDADEITVSAEVSKPMTSA